MRRAQTLCARQAVGLLTVSVFVSASVVVGGEGKEQADRITVKTVVGHAESVSPDGDTVKVLRVGTRVLLGWHVRTAKESSVELKLESGTVLRIGENSEITLSDKLHASEQSPEAPIKRKDAL
jgi:hypothetical protein